MNVGSNLTNAGSQPISDLGQKTRCSPLLSVVAKRFQYKSNMPIRTLSCFLLSLFLLACVGTSNNRIGVGWFEEERYERQCVSNVLANIDDLENIQYVKGSYKFLVNRYKGNLTYGEVTPGKLGYELDLDGMFLGESAEEFFANSRSIQDEISSNLQDQCRSG